MSIKLKSNEAVDITVPTQDEVKRKEAKGVLPEERFEDYIPRRLQNEILLTIYGLNLKLGEDSLYHDLDFQIEPSVTGTIDRSGGWSSEIKKLTIDRFSESNWASFYSKLFEIDVENWAANYKQIAHDIWSPYSLFVKDKANVTRELKASSVLDDPSSLATYGLQWAADGLKVKRGDVTELHIDPAYDSPFFRFDTNSSDYKVTDTYDHTASAAAFSIDKSCDVYLIPRIGLNISYTVGVTNDTSDPTHFDQTVWDNFLNIVYRCVPTEMFPQWRDHTVNITTPTTDPSGYFQDYVDWMKSLTTTRNFIFNYRFYFPTGGSANSTDIGSPGFQTSADYPELGADGVFRYLYRFMSFRIQDLSRLQTIEPNGYTTDFNGLFFDEPSDPQLVAVIKKGTTFYYVWNMTGDIASEALAYTSSAGTLRIFYNNP